MACTLTTGRKVPCKSAFGGIKTVYFADFGDVTAVTVDATTKEATITGTPTWYEYDVKGNSSLETTVTSSRENGTTFYTQTLNLTLTYLDAKTQAELQTLAVARPQVVPSLVTLGPPQDLSRTTVRPLGPRVLLTALASFSTPASRA